MATQFNYPTTYLRFGGKISPVNSTHEIGMLESFYLQGGLKTIQSFSDIDDSYNTNSWIPDGRRQIGSIVYVQDQNIYIMDVSGSGKSIQPNQGYQTMSALTPGGTPFFENLSINNCIKFVDQKGGNPAASICYDDELLNISGPTQQSAVIFADGIIQLGQDNDKVNLQYVSYTPKNTTGSENALYTDGKYVSSLGFAVSSSSGYGDFQITPQGNLFCNTLNETSLRQIKTNIEYITSSQLQNIAKLKPITFVYKQDYSRQNSLESGIRQAGFIAQQMEEVYQDIVWYKNGQLGGIQYQRLTAYLVKGIQELTQKNRQLQQRIQNLQTLLIAHNGEND